jgi:fucose 4-O-acetylase-like acetyltransferase
MVVMGHTRSGDFVYHSVNFVHMALFFLLAGCTNRKDGYYAEGENLRAFFGKRIKSLYLPFLKYSIPVILLHNVFYQQGWYTHGYDFYGWVIQIGRTLLFSIGKTEPLLAQLWFIKVLFIMEILYAVLLYFFQKWNINKWIVIVPVGVVALLVDYRWFPVVCRMNIIVPLRALLLYAIGGEMWRLTKTKSKTLMAVSMGATILWLYTSTLFEDTSILGSWGYVGLLIVPFSVSFFVVAWGLCKYIMKISIVDKLMEYIGRNTMPVYFLHYVAFRVIRISYLWLTGADTAYSRNHQPCIHWTIYVVLSIAISLLFYELLCYTKRIVITSR